MKREFFLDSDGVVQAIETETQILGLFGKYRPLSNFHKDPVEVDGITYRWSEAAYMVEKTLDEDEKHLMLLCNTPGEASGANLLKTSFAEIFSFPLEISTSKRPIGGEMTIGGNPLPMERTI